MTILSDRQIAALCTRPTHCANVAQWDTRKVFRERNELTCVETGEQFEHGDHIGVSIIGNDQIDWHPMIAPFVPNQVKTQTDPHPSSTGEDDASRRIISYGLTSYGYDVRLGRKFKIFTNINSTVIDPMNMSDDCYVDFEGDVCIIPPHSYALATQIETHVIQRCIEFIRNGSFLTDDSPAKRFATEVTAEMEKQLLPIAQSLELTPESLGQIAHEMLKADPFGAKHNCLPRRDQKYVASLKDAPPTEIPVAQIPWTTAVMLFRTQIGQKFMRDGLAPESIDQMLNDALTTYSSEVDQKLKEVLASADALALYERRLVKSDYGFGARLDVEHVSKPEVDEDGVRIEKDNT